VARVFAIVSDLMLASRVTEGLRAAGHDVVVAPDLTTVPPEVDAIVCDLDLVDAAAVVEADLPVLGFYSHVDVETRRRAEAAGVDLVVPRSRMARELPQLVEGLLSD